MIASQRTLTILTLCTLVLTFIVIVLGAYTRLSDAGLGCPDWPGCYGQLIVPASIQQPLQAFPDSLFDSRKAWIEMVHRYAAGTLGLMIFAIACVWFTRREKPSIYTPYLLVALVIFQALLGMWTVTLKLHPFIVMAHLLGGMLLFATLIHWYCRLQQVHAHWQPPTRKNAVPYWVALGIAVVFVQIALGGWVSANYAAVACIGFPYCNGQWWPNMNFSAAFNLWAPLGINYEFGVLDNPSRVAIQMVHRIGAVVTLVYVGALATWIAYFNTNRTARLIAASVLILLLVQFLLGIINVVAVLPLSNAVAHNAVAALLLGALVVLYNRLS